MEQYWEGTLDELPSYNDSINQFKFLFGCTEKETNLFKT